MNHINEVWMKNIEVTLLFAVGCEATKGKSSCKGSPEKNPTRLHSSVGRALHRYHGGHGFNSH